MPAGSTWLGNQSISVSSGAEYKTIDAIKSISVPLSTGEVVRLSDVASVYDKLKDLDSISRFDGQDVVTVSVKKQQSASAVKVSNAVREELKKLEADNPSLKDHISYDSRDTIMETYDWNVKGLANAS